MYQNTVSRLENLFQESIRRPEAEREAASQGEPTTAYTEYTQRRLDAGWRPRSRPKPGATFGTGSECAAAILLALGSLQTSVPATGVQAPSPLKVCATIPDLGELAKEVGGDQVGAFVFAKGSQDPHFLEAKPSFIKELSTADLFIQNGLELEIGWAPNLWQNSRNGRVLPGAQGFLDASRAVAPLDLPSGAVDRSLGDVHPMGNPHYLTDPVNGLRVARAILERLQAIRPERSDYFKRRYEDFAKRVNTELVGRKLAEKYDAEKLALLAEHGKLDDFLSKQGDGKVEGWLGRMAPYRGVLVVADHNIWPYFAARFGLKIVGFLEPKAGIAPTTKHLSRLIAEMKQKNVQAILAVPYFDPRHARFVSDQTGAKVVSLAHQCGAQPGTETYIALNEHNVRQVEATLGGAR